MTITVVGINSDRDPLPAAPALDRHESRFLLAVHGHTFGIESAISVSGFRASGFPDCGIVPAAFEPLRLLAPYRFGQVVGPSRASLDAVIIITRLPANVNIYNDLQVLSIPLLALDLRLLNSRLVNWREGQAGKAMRREKLTTE
jgi:hypothetical protein